MEKERRSHMTERILDLTLEIIYLLTGEEYVITRKIPGDHIMANSLRVSQRCSRKHRLQMEHSTSSFISDPNNDKKILEVTKEIIQLLTGEVPIRCHDVTVYFSMEEWEYLEEHKDFYKEAKMKKPPPSTSPYHHGSKNVSPPDRCPRPLYSQDTKQEHQEIPQNHQKIPHVLQVHGNEGPINPAEKCSRSLYSWDSTQESQEIPKEHQMIPHLHQVHGHEGPRPLNSWESTLKVSREDQLKGGCISNVRVTKKEEDEEICVDNVVLKQDVQVQTDAISTSKNTQRRCLKPPSFRNSAQEHQKVSYHDQLGVKAQETERATDNFLRIDIQKEQACLLNVKAEDTKRLEDKCLMTDVPKKCPLNIDAKVKEKEENKILRIDVEKREHPFNIKGKEMVEDTFLRTEIHRNDRQLNVERQENPFLRTDVEKKEQEDPPQSWSNRNAPNKCPSLLYHWDSTGEHHKAPGEKGKRLHNIKVEVMERDDERYMWRDTTSKDQDSSSDGSNNRNTPEGSRSPLYSWVSPMDNHKVLSNYQEEKLTPQQAKGRGAPEKTSGRGEEQCKEDGTPPEIGTDGRYRGYSMEKRPTIFPDGEMEDDVAGDSFEETPIGANPYTIPHNVGQSAGTSMNEGSFRSLFPSVAHRTYRRRGETFMCSECGECFTAKAKLFKHQRDHIVDKPHSCPDCGKCFVEKSHLVNHQRSHSVEKPYSCSICGKCFGEKGHLANHEKSHANEKEFFCYDCGKCFTQRGHFNRHQRLHTGEKPYPCPECGKCFPHKEYLIRHLRVHAGQKPFPCSECGKCFTDKYDLAKHERIHSGQRPYSCHECGRGFTQKSNLARHVRVHSDFNRIHVLTVDNGSPGEPSSTISVPKEDKRFLYQEMNAE